MLLVNANNYFFFFIAIFPTQFIEWVLFFTVNLHSGIVNRLIVSYWEGKSGHYRVA